MNKKIRYAIGAVGAMPTLAMMPVPFAAATVVTHAGKTPASIGKKVRTVYARDTAANMPSSISRGTSSDAVSPNIGPQACTSNGTGHFSERTSTRGHFFVSIFRSSHGCVVFEQAHLNFNQPERLQRIRVNQSGHTYQAPLTHGNAHGNVTSFSANNINHRGASICIALVNQNSIHQVTNGPVCFPL